MEIKSCSIRIVIKNEFVFEESILKWLEEAPSFEVSSFLIEDRKFVNPIAWDKDLFHTFFIKEWSKKPPVFIKFMDNNQNKIMFGKGKNNSSIIIDVVDPNASVTAWIEYTKTFFENDNKAIVACIYPKGDYFWQMNLDPDRYESAGKSLENLELKPFSQTMSTIDPKSLPGYANYIDDIWFGSTWIMIFGQKYFEFISQSRLQSYPNAFAIEVLENETIFVKLFENLEDYDTLEARKIQFDFRNYIDRDELVKRLRKLYLE
ncbi:hypothetical protein PQ456_01295 [Paenibacillus kyungheensis]|uniref:Uncharacterized protein n=1 Tax=Paenibacillus kyungheensis TaxID=1452732 RepID=A0AAX3M1U0_9BACL|nr:hypothetical protein [Paenibacillus kyungheensis]WCT56192.1 hypothetical protein PQ456_01295 [Paenibacillus kyungheensis]